MGKKSGPPKPPDPYQTAQAQTQSNLATARAETEMNRYNQNTPYGSVSWTNNGDRWTQNTTESENQRALREREERQGIMLGDLGIEQTGRVSQLLGQPYDPRRLSIADALGDYGSDVEQRTYDLATRRLGQEFDRGEESLRSRLAAQGINAGSDAFGSELRDFNNARGDAYANAQLMARGQAQSDRGQALGELLTQYGSDTTADQAARTNPLNEIIALASGVQTNPINPGQGAMTNLQGVDIGGLINQNYANQLGAYNSRMQSRNGLLGSLAGLGSAAFTGWGR